MGAYPGHYGITGIINSCIGRITPLPLPHNPGSMIGTTSLAYHIHVHVDVYSIHVYLDNYYIIHIYT